MCAIMCSCGIRMPCEAKVTDCPHTLGNTGSVRLCDSHQVRTACHCQKKGCRMHKGPAHGNGAEHIAAFYCCVTVILYTTQKIQAAFLSGEARLAFWRSKLACLLAYAKTYAQRSLTNLIQLDKRRKHPEKILFCAHRNKILAKPLRSGFDCYH